MKATIVNQPEKYQVSNYNIFPAPQIKIDNPITQDCSVSLDLVENELLTVITG